MRLCHVVWHGVGAVPFSAIKLGVQVPRVGLLKWIESRSVGVLPQPYIPGVPSKGDKMHRQGGYITFFVLFSHF